MLTAMYPGSFDPLTFGHLDIMQRGLQLFSRLVVAVAHNAAKRHLFSPDERVAMIREALPQAAAAVDVVQFDGLLVDEARRLGVQVLLRGLRPGNDFIAEYPMAVANRRQHGGLETLLMPCHAEHAAISSRMVREIAELHGDTAPFVPATVAARLRRKFP